MLKGLLLILKASLQLIKLCLTGSSCVGLSLVVRGTRGGELCGDAGLLTLNRLQILLKLGGLIVCGQQRTDSLSVVFNELALLLLKLLYAINLGFVGSLRGFCSSAQRLFVNDASLKLPLQFLNGALVFKCCIKPCLPQRCRVVDCLGQLSANASDSLGGVLGNLNL